MRIDKYLKLTRIIKRRQISKEIVDQGRVEVNGRVVKPAFTIKGGDQILMRFTRNIIEVEVLEIDEKLIKKNPDGAYKIVSERVNETKSRQE